MFDFHIEQFCPKFILRDRNGYALAKAIEAALQYMNNIVGDSVKLIYDYDSMPEWRLDELAWETNCLYDFHADVESKRQWIRNATKLYQMSGTKYAVWKYLAGYFEEVEVEEAWNYDSDPFHFRVIVAGEWTPENEVWARNAIAKAKNVRSVLDGFTTGTDAVVGMEASTDSIVSFPHKYCGELLCGEAVF